MRNRQSVARSAERSRIAIFAGALLVLVLSLFWLAQRYWLRPSEDPTRQAAAQIAQDCAGGRHVDNRAKIEAGLGRYLTRATAETEVASSDVGSVISKLTPDGVGLSFYKIYVQCLKDRTEDYLKLKGVAVVPDRERREERPAGQPVARPPTDNSHRPTAEARKVARKPPVERVPEAVRCNVVSSVNQSGGITACETVTNQGRP